MSASAEHRLVVLADLGREYADLLVVIRREVAALLADDVGWTAVAAALGCTRQVVRAHFLDWPRYRQLNRARNRAAAAAE